MHIYKYNYTYLLHSHYIKYSSCLHISLSCNILPRWSLPIGLSYIKHRIPGRAMLYSCISFQPLNSDRIKPYYPLKNDNAMICPLTASYSHCFISHVYFYTQYIQTRYTSKISVNTRGRTTHTAKPFLQKIWSEGVLRRLTHLLYPRPRYYLQCVLLHYLYRMQGRGARGKAGG